MIYLSNAFKFKWKIRNLIKITQLWINHEKMDSKIIVDLVSYSHGVIHVTHITIYSSTVGVNKHTSPI